MTEPNSSLRQIPLVDLKAQRDSIRADLRVAIDRVIDRCDFILGRDVEDFEKEFAAFCGVSRSIGVASGTDALHLACRALGLGPGDEVIIPAMTFVATALGVSLAGARPVLVDVLPESGLMDPRRVEAAITSRTRAIMPVHLFGQCADMTSLRRLAAERKLYVIEDAAQAHGATHGTEIAGAMGDAGCFSFYPGKNLGAYGDGGAITAANPETIDRLLLLRNWGSVKKYHHDEMGLNSRLDTIQAAILRVKLARLRQWNATRKRIADTYSRRLGAVSGIELTRYDSGSIHHLYVMRVDRRDEILAALQKRGIGAGIHYPFAVHELRAYRWLGYKPGDFPVAERWARRCLSLPIYAEMTDADVDYVVDGVCATLGATSAQ